jgi:hypothetical protein
MLHIPRRQLVPMLATWTLALSAPAALTAATIVEGDVTSVLGPTFFVDDATLGGSDTDISHASTASFVRLFDGILTPNQGPTRVTLTGFGFATHTSATANDATTVAVTFTYLGADGIVGGGDDVSIGTATGSFTFSGGKEYVFVFDTPLTADLTITGTRFRIQVAPVKTGTIDVPTDTALKLKTGALASEPSVTSAKLSVAGVATSLINPQRVNLAKFQPVTASSVSGQRLASYVTDGVVGNDNRWQGNGSAWQSVIVDFPFPVEIGSAQVFTGVDDGFPISSYGLQFWNGSAWTAISGGSVTGNTSTERNLVFTSPVTASSFRLLSSETSLRVRELALYPPNGPGGFPLGTDLTVNLAYQRPAVASANTAGNFALKAVDGRAHVGSIWQTTTAGINTLDIDLRVSTKIGSAHLYSGSTGVPPLADFVMKYWDGTTWQDISGGTVAGNTTADRVIPLTPVTTSRVRLEFTNPGTTSIRELCIFPANPGNVGYPIGTNIIGSGAIAEYETYHDAFHLITNSASNLKLSVPGNGQPALDPGGLTVGQTQYQVLLNLSNGTYRLRNRASGNCLSGAQLSKTPGLPLTDSPYSALPHQDWILDPLGGGAFRIINSWSGLVIDTQGAATAAGTPLVQSTTNGSPSQRWQISYFAGHPKKGIGGTTFAMATNPNWAYNWGRRNTNTLPEDSTFFPMQWGSSSWDIGSAQGPLWQEYTAWRTRADGIHLLAFNEPDRTDQSNIPQSTVLSVWPRLQELDQPLVSPSPGTIGGDGGWLDSFYTQADALGYRVDYTAVHTYPGPSAGSSNNLINFVNSAYTYNSRNRPVWLTEFSFVDWGKNQTWSEEDNYNCLAEFLWRAENLPALRKYALFVFTEDEEYPQPPNAWQAVTPAPRSNSYDINGNMTAFGKLYAAWDGDTAVRTDKTYHLHHKASRKRIANLTTQSNLSGRNIRIDGGLVNWTLVSAGASNRYHIVSSLDGRRVRRQNSDGSDNPDGASVALVAAGSTGPALEWALTPAQHGWYFIEHPTLATRLKLVYNNSNFVSTYSMVASSNAGDDVQWRFIVPVRANTAPVLAAIPAQTVNEGTQVAFTASASDTDPFGPTIYSLVGAPGGASINSTTGAFTWTPNESQGPNIYNFTVRASDGRLAQNLPVTVTVNEVNAAPVLAAIPAQTVNEGAELTFTASTIDADLPANTLVYSLVGAPGGATIDSGTGLFTWPPSEAQGPGVFNFSVHVSDGNLTHDRPVSVTVNEINAAPTLAAIPPRTVNKNNLLTFTAAAIDDDLPANILTYTLVDAPVGASIHATTGIFTWTPSEAQGPGLFNFTVRVSDGSLAHDQAASVTVIEPNVAPVLASIPAQTVNEGTELTFTAIATDTDIPANTLTYSLIGEPVGASIDGNTGVFTWTPSEAQGPATFNFTVRVSDGNLTHDQPVSVTVTDDSGDDILGTWIIAGQSNAEGYGITENPINGLAPPSTLATIGRSDLNVVHNNIQMFQGANDFNAITASAGSSLPPRDTWHAMTAQEGLAFDWGSGRGNESRRRFGPELAFGYDVQRQLGSPIALIKYARGSSSIAPSTAQSGDVWRDFDPSDGGRLNQYDKLIATIQAAVNSLPTGQVLKMRGVVWMQGESDATAAAAPSYQANLTELIAALRADIGAIANASGGRLTRSAASWNELDVFIGTVQNTNIHRQTVIDAQNAVAAADPNVFTVNGTTGLSMMTFDDWGDSGVHYDTAGQVLLGERFADAAISRIDSGVLVSESAGATSVTEGGATDTYTITLTRAPSSDVTVNIITDSQVSVSPSSLTFTTVNWNTPQTITVTAVDDTVNESNHAGSISHVLSSLDLSFGGLPIAGVSLAIIDNDPNTAPVLASIPPQTVIQGTLLTFTAAAIDNDLPANILTYSLVGAPVGASIHASTGIFTWTPTIAQGPGVFNFTVQVNDGNLTHDQPVSVAVESPLPSPEADTDGDGLSDLLESAFLTDPEVPNANPFRVTGSTAGTVTLEFPWNWQTNGIRWQIRHGHDLSNIPTWPVVAPGATTTIREGNIDRITVTPAMTYPDRGFYVLEVIAD